MKKLLFLIVCFVSFGSFAQNMQKPATGEQAKDFSLKTVSGETVTLSEMLKAKPVVLVVLRGWPGYQCPICSRQVGSLLSLAADFEKHQVSVLLVYPGPSQELIDHAKEFKEDFDFPENFVFTLDPDYSMINSYGLRWDANRETAYPSTFIINRDGEIVYSKISQTHGDRSDAGELIEVLNKL